MIELFLFYLVFFAVALALPTVRVWRQTGINPIVLPADDSVAGFVGRAFKLLILLLGVYLFVGVLGLAKPVGAIPLPPPTWEIGWTLLAVSLVWIVVAQYQMGRSWRVGVDINTKTELVVEGLFRASRNPIFLGMLVQLIGLFLVQSDAVTFAILLSAYFLISVQIRQEEEHLGGLHGAEYARYRQSVRRWI